MLYLAPIKYYDNEGQLHFYKIISDFFGDEISLEQLNNIENNLRLLKPKEFHFLVRYLYEHPLIIKENEDNEVHEQ